jgi:hypothetical protein
VRTHPVDKLLVCSCCDKSGTSCYHLVTRLMMVTDLLQVVPTKLIQAVRNYKLLRTCCHQLNVIRADYQTCWNNLLRVCWPRQPCYKMIKNLFQTCQQLGTSSANTLVDNLAVRFLGGGTLGFTVWRY